VSYCRETIQINIGNVNIVMNLKKKKCIFNLGNLICLTNKIPLNVTYDEFHETYIIISIPVDGIVSNQQ